MGTDTTTLPDLPVHRRMHSGRWSPGLSGRDRMSADDRMQWSMDPTVRFITEPSRVERVERACTWLHDAGYGSQLPMSAVVWHEPGELPGDPVCTVTILTTD